MDFFLTGQLGALKCCLERSWFSEMQDERKDRDVFERYLGKSTTQLCFPSLRARLAIHSPTGVFLKGEAALEDWGAHLDFCCALCAPGRHWWVSPWQHQEQLLR